jgi:polyisoprenoid-binding protein YceI
MSPLLAYTQSRPIDTAHSMITVRVGKSGFFSAFGHNHEIRAPISEGDIDENATKPHVEFRVDARQLKVLDPEVKASEREQVQQTMLGPEVLDSQKFPEIRFRSTAIEKAGNEKWKVTGELKLHGQMHAVQASVDGRDGHYRGTANFKQTEFGIKPVAVAGGTVKVKDELRIEFEITAR